MPHLHVQRLRHVCGDGATRCSQNWGHVLHSGDVLAGCPAPLDVWFPWPQLCGHPACEGPEVWVPEQGACCPQQGLLSTRCPFGGVHQHPLLLVLSLETRKFSGLLMCLLVGKHICGLSVPSGKAATYRSCSNFSSNIN